MKFEKSILAMMLVTALSACTFDGENGTDGANGAPGIDGADGANGDNAPTSLTIALVGRAVLNSQDPEGAAEIVDFQKSKNWLYAINSSLSSAVVEIIDASTIDGNALTPDAEGVVNTTNLSPAITLDLTATTGLTGDANSIAIDNTNELLAVAIASGTAGINGHISFFELLDFKIRL